MVIFTHIPRTGGTTLQRIAEQNYEREEILRLYGGAISDPRGYMEQVTWWGDPRFVTGHNAYGVHNYIPAKAIKSIDSFQYITILRDPIDRCVSVYDYIKRSPSHHLHQATKVMDLKTFATSGITTELDNGMTRQISGECGRLPQKPWPDAKVPVGAMKPFMLGVAEMNLRENYTLVGILGNFEDTLRLCRERLGWTDTTYEKRVNTSPKKRNKWHLDAETHAVLRRLNDYDFALYEHGKALFEAAIA